VKIFAAWTMTAALLVGACGGNVVLDTSSGTGTGNSGTGHSGTGASAMTSSGVSGSGTGQCVPTCALAVQSGGVPCGDGFPYYQTLLSCAGCNDAGNCGGVCGATLCGNGVPDGPCSDCVKTVCSAELFACQNN
jgi:hypothetical protein